MTDPSLLVRTLPYVEGQPIPAGYTLRERPSHGLLIGGAVGFGVSYVMALALSWLYIETCTDDEDEIFHFGPTCSSSMWTAVIPFFGPFIAAGGERVDDLYRVTFVFLGLAQTAGIVMLGAGANRKRRLLVRNDLAEIHLAPLAYGGTLRGMALAGAW